jgi:hypothetical protein
MARTWLGRGAVVALACGVLVVVAQAQQPPGVGTAPPPPSSGTLPPPALDPGPVPPMVLTPGSVPPSFVPTPTPPSTIPSPAPAYGTPDVGPVQPATMPRPSAPPSLSIEEILTAMEAVKKQRESLDQKEKQLADLLRDRLKAVNARMSKLGVDKAAGRPMAAEKAADMKAVDFVSPPRPEVPKVK